MVPTFVLNTALGALHIIFVTHQYAKVPRLGTSAIYSVYGILYTCASDVKNKHIYELHYAVTIAHTVDHKSNRLSILRQYNKREPQAVKEVIKNQYFCTSVATASTSNLLGKWKRCSDPSINYARRSSELKMLMGSKLFVSPIYDTTFYRYLLSRVTFPVRNYCAFKVDRFV